MATRIKTEPEDDKTGDNVIIKQEEDEDDDPGPPIKPEPTYANSHDSRECPPFHLLVSEQRASAFAKAVGTEVIAIPYGTYPDWERENEGKKLKRFGRYIGHDNTFTMATYNRYICSTGSDLYAVQEKPKETDPLREWARLDSMQEGPPIYLICNSTHQVAHELGLRHNRGAIIRDYPRFVFRYWETITTEEKDVRVNFGQFKNCNVDNLPPGVKENLSTNTKKLYWFLRQAPSSDRIVKPIKVASRAKEMRFVRDVNDIQR